MPTGTITPIHGGLTEAEATARIDELWERCGMDDTSGTDAVKAELVQMLMVTNSEGIRAGVRSATIVES